MRKSTFHKDHFNESYLQVQVRQVHVGNNQIGGTTRLVMGSDQNGPKYTVQETVIDGKKTLILDHNDLARLLQSNNGNAVVLHQGVIL